MDGRWKCEGCDWIGSHEEVLRAHNPFAPSEELWGCPECFEANRFVRTCDNAECRQIASNGTPTPNGYVWSCFKHRPDEKVVITTTFEEK